MKNVLHLHLRLESSHFIPQIQRVPGYGYIHLLREPKYLIDDSMNSRKVLMLRDVEPTKRFVRKHDIAIAHSHHADIGLLLLPLRKKAKVPLAVSVRGRDATFAEQPPEYHDRLKRLFQTADRFFPVCQHLADTIIDLGCPPDKIRVLYGGVNLKKFSYVRRSVGKSQHILSVGRLVEKKGHHILMQAFAKIRHKFQRATLTIIGRGKMQEELKRLAAQLKLGDSFSLLDSVEYRLISEAFKAADIFCAASLTSEAGDVEGIPNTLKEAMATGLPVISTYHSGIPELVTSAYDGLLVNENNVDQLAIALEYMLSHPEMWKRFGERARQTVSEKFNLNQQLLKQAELYNELGG